MANVQLAADVEQYWTKKREWMVKKGGEDGGVACDRFKRFLINLHTANFTVPETTTSSSAPVKPIRDRDIGRRDAATKRFRTGNETGGIMSYWSNDFQRALLEQLNDQHFRVLESDGDNLDYSGFRTRDKKELFSAGQLEGAKIMVYMLFTAYYYGRDPLWVEPAQGEEPPM